MKFDAYLTPHKDILLPGVAMEWVGPYRSLHYHLATSILPPSPPPLPRGRHHYYHRCCQPNHHNVAATPTTNIAATTSTTPYPPLYHHHTTAPPLSPSYDHHHHSTNGDRVYLTLKTKPHPLSFSVSLEVVPFLFEFSTDHQS
ncbi:hypothetical protein AMTRI_Chr08g164760 [Amborella trichopoda]